MNMEEDMLIEKLLAQNYRMTRKQTEEKLVNIYNELNATRFNHDLPKKAFVRVSLRTDGNTATFKSMGKFVSIYVSPFCKPEDYRRTMFHEMCHFFAPDHHSDAFVKKLTQVAEGELWLEKEMAKVQQWQIIDRIRPDWSEVRFKLLKEKPRMPWIEARRAVAERLGCKVHDMCKEGPDFKKEWLVLVALAEMKKRRPKL